MFTQWSQRFVQGDVPRQAVNVRDPMRLYIPNKMTLLLTDPVLSGIRNLLKARIIDAGLAFMVGGKISDPDPEFEHVVRVHWEPFMGKALDFMLVYGYLVWYQYKPHPDAAPVPAVPDHDQLSVGLIYGEDGAPLVMAEWKDRELREKVKLYVFYHPIPFRVTPAHPQSPVDQVTSLLAMMYTINEAHATAAMRNANPTMVLQRPTLRNPNESEDGFGARARDTQYDQRDAFDAALDDMALSRIQALANYKQTEQIDAVGMPVGQAVEQWFERADRNLRTPAEARQVLISYGLQFSRTIEAREFGNWSGEYLMLQQQVYNAFGLPVSAIGGASEKTSKGAELQDESMVHATTKYRRLLSTLMTDVFRVIYSDPDERRVTSSKRTATRGAPGASGEKAKDPQKTSEPKKEAQKDQKGQKAEAVEEMDPADRFFSSGGYKAAKARDVVVILASDNQVSAVDAAALFYDRVINRATFQQIAARSVGLNPSLVDPTLKDPTDLVDQATLASAQNSSRLTGKRDGSGSGPAAKKAKLES